MILDPRRVLILGHESPRLFALSGYLTGRGFQVDRARAVEEARALLHHLPYLALVASVNVEHADSPSALLLVEARTAHLGVRTVALTESAIGGGAVPEWLRADLVIEADLPVAQMGKALCGSLAE